MQTVDPATVLYVPWPHVRHVLMLFAPTAELAVPAAHWVHVAALVALQVPGPQVMQLAALEPEYVPAEHVEHDAAPSLLNEPAPQVRHVAALVAPSVPLKVPAAQLVHDEALPLLQVPDPHCVHVAALDPL